jgi:general secretion pathway protein G
MRRREDSAGFRIFPAGGDRVGGPLDRLEGVKVMRYPPRMKTATSLAAAALRRTFGERMFAFTLLELLVVVAIIGLLAGYVGPKFFGQLGKAEVKAARAQIDGLEKALDQYRLDVGRYPSSEQGLNALMTQPSGATRWAGPYLKKGLPPDPWGKLYLYKAPGDHGEFDLFSYGRDGVQGGSGEDADITNW